jgi:hypothetical protein
LAYDAGELLHVPAEATKVCPCTGVPVTTGGALFTGGDTDGADRHGLVVSVVDAIDDRLPAVSYARMPTV